MAAKTATEIVTMICPNLACRRTVSAPAKARGNTVRCAYCQQPFRVPESAPQVEDEVDDRGPGKRPRR